MPRYLVLNGPGCVTFDKIDKARAYLYEEMKHTSADGGWKIYYDSDVSVSYKNGAHFVIPKKYVGEMRSMSYGGVYGCTYRDARTNNISWVNKDGSLSKNKMKW